MRRPWRTSLRNSTIREQTSRIFVRPSNNKIESYFLSGMSHPYRLVEAIQGMLEDQEKEFCQARAQDEAGAAREYVGRDSEYLGEVSHIVS
ncbi:hypothetical protein FDECE_4760 [Fusarium decemcellulare]|nr:hypothetical protein FDECE_4760 [Fusarium decemcellulare]